VTANAAGLVLRLADFIGLGAKRQRAPDRDEKESHRTEQAKACFAQSQRYTMAIK
jgi:hypothetical protein